MLPLNSNRPAHTGPSANPGREQDGNAEGSPFGLDSPARCPTSPRPPVHPLSLDRHADSSVSLGVSRYNTSPRSGSRSGVQQSRHQVVPLRRQGPTPVGEKQPFEPRFPKTKRVEFLSRSGLMSRSGHDPVCPRRLPCWLLTPPRWLFPGIPRKSLVKKQTRYIGAWRPPATSSSTARSVRR